jgi:hypothetical protein
VSTVLRPDPGLRGLARERAREVIRQVKAAAAGEGPGQAVPAAVSAACGTAGMFLTALASADDSWRPGMVLQGGGMWLIISSVITWILLSARSSLREDGK